LYSYAVHSTHSDLNIGIIPIPLIADLLIFNIQIKDNELSAAVVFFWSAFGNIREPTSRAELMSWFETQGRAALHWLETECTDAGVPLSTKLLAGGVSELVLRDAAQAQLLPLAAAVMATKMIQYPWGIISVKLHTTCTCPCS